MTLRILMILAFVAPSVQAAAPSLPSTEELGLYYTLGGASAVPPNPG